VDVALAVLVTRRHKHYEAEQMTVERMRYAFVVAALATAACRETPRQAADSGAASAPAPAAATVTPAAPASPALLDAAHSTERAPDVFGVRFETTRGSFVVEAHRAWAPLGVDRFHYLVRNGFYDGTRFFRVLNGFMAQFGINGDPRITASWRERRITDDPPRQSNVRGAVSFASAGPQSRTTQLFINFRDNLGLDKSYPPIGKVVEGMAAVDSLWKEYGEGAPMGNGPEQERVMTEGETYLAKDFPKLDQVKKAELVK
jgi:peptidyl-prolyl cis-trans isomerase A (cyclophilin A)